MEGVSAGQLCMTGKNHEPSKPNELQYSKGDLVLILSDLLEDGLHYMASTANGSIGHFPSSDIRFRSPIPMLPMPWFHSSVSRLEAEKILNRNQDGQFLLRTSQNTKAVYALAVSFRGSVMHYLVAMDYVTRKVTLNGEVYFNNLPELVGYYWKQSPHLCCPLRVPAVKRSTLEFYIDQEELRKSWGIERAELRVADELENIGQGEFGEVQVATYRGTQVAVKHIHSSKQSAAAVTSFLKEATIFTHLRHKNLVQLVGVVYHGSTIHSIVMELLGKGSLQKYLISRGRSVVSQSELLSFAKDVCEGMLYISSRGYVHRDVAARNVLLNSNGQAKVSDFGLLRKADIHVPHEGGKFPVKWTAPEALKESKFSIQSDVWSFGVLLWEIYSYGRVPYPSIPADEVLGMLEDGIVMDPPDSCPDTMYNVMCRCWKLEPNDRPSFLALREVLAKTSAGSNTPFGSPLLLRRINAPMPEFKVDDLAMSPTAEQSYQDAPLKRKVTMLIGNIVFLGPQSSGKTSLLKSLTGEPFQLTEPLSKAISIGENYHLMADNESWAQSSGGLMYEDELVRIIVEDLLKHALRNPPTSNGSSLTPPSLPPRRVQSFSHTQSTKLAETYSKSDRLSGSYETINTPDLAEGRSHSAADGEEVRSPKLKSKHRLGKLGSRKAKAEIKRTFSDSVKSEYKVHQSPELTRPVHQSSIPEQLVVKIKSTLRESSGCTLPAKHYGKLVDTPGHCAFQQLKPLFVTESSLCVLTFDVSKDIMTPNIHRKLSNGKQSMPSYYQPSGSKYSKDCCLSDLMKEISDLCLLWSHSQSDLTLCGPRILLVGTHSDKVPSTISHRNFELLQDAVKASPYGKYVTLLKFIVSNSSIIERTSTDDLRHYVMELVKKSCRQQVPLKWLRCIRRFKGFSKKSTYFLSLSEARKIISQICDISDEAEISKVVHFLHQNLVILHFHRLHHLKEIVITDPVWFVSKISQVFSASYVDLQAEGAPELLHDQEVLRTTGLLSSPLLNFVWWQKNTSSRFDELLSIMCKMDLCCCMGSGSHPLPVTSSVEDLTSERPAHKSRSPNSLSSVVIPGLVEDRKPTHLATLPSYNIEPIIFKFKTGHVPSGLFSRLLVRCVQSYPRDYSIFRNGATFEVDNSTLLMISLEADYIKMSLHKIRSSSVTESLPSSLDVTDLDSLLNDPNTPSPDLCLAVLMFLKATLTDLIQQWTPHLDFDLCVSCDCHAHLEEEPDGSLDESRKVSTGSIRPRSPGEKHYIILNDVDSMVQSSVRCEHGTMVGSAVSLGCWFGEAPSDAMSSSSPTDHMDLITDSDLGLVVSVLGKSWVELGHTLGFTRKEVQRFSLSGDTCAKAGESMLKKWVTNNPKTASFFTLLGALEIVQRRDIADELVAARMEDEGISL